MNSFRWLFDWLHNLRPIFYFSSLSKLWVKCNLCCARTFKSHARCEILICPIFYNLYTAYYLFSSPIEFLLVFNIDLICNVIRIPSDGGWRRNIYTYVFCIFLYQRVFWWYFPKILLPNYQFCLQCNLILLSLPSV